MALTDQVDYKNSIEILNVGDDITGRLITLDAHLEEICRALYGGSGSQPKDSTATPVAEGWFDRARQQQGQQLEQIISMDKWMERIRQFI